MRVKSNDCSRGCVVMRPGCLRRGGTRGFWESSTEPVALTDGERTKHVVVTGRGVVAQQVRQREGVQAHVGGRVDIQATSLALAAGAAFTALGLVVGDFRVPDGHGAGADIDAAALAVAAVGTIAPGAALGLVVGDFGVPD